MQFSLESTRQILKDNPNYRINSEGEVFSYCSGKWRLKKSHITDDGYYRITLWVKPNIGKKFLIHRLLYQTFIEDIPSTLDIDHADGDRLNNALTNLRLATRAENLQNSRKKAGKHPYKGVVYNSRAKLWAARITINKVVKSLKCHKSPLQAAVAYDLAAHKAFGKFARLNVLKVADTL